MSEHNDGGPAFPGFSYTELHGCMRRTASGEWEIWEPGMSLRQYYKAKALPAVIERAFVEEWAKSGPEWVDGIAGECGRIADCMLMEDYAHAERNRRAEK